MRALGALVLAVADQRRLRAKRVGGSRGLEVELHHLPVPFVFVVEVVEDVEEPELESDLARIRPIGRHPRIRPWGPALVDAV